MVKHKKIIILTTSICVFMVIGAIVLAWENKTKNNELVVEGYKSEEMKKNKIKSEKETETEDANEEIINKEEVKKEDEKTENKKYSESTVTKPFIEKTNSSKSSATKSATTKSSSAKAATTKSSVTKPTTTKSSATKPTTTKSSAAKPSKPTQPKPTQPKAEDKLPEEIVYRGQKIRTTGFKPGDLEEAKKEIDKYLDNKLIQYRKRKKDHPEWFSEDGYPLEETMLQWYKELKAGGINP